MYRIITIVIALIVAGCATTRPYPLCFCNATPTHAQYIAIEKDIATILLKYAKHDTAVRFSTDHRWVVAKTTKRENKQIEQIWPAIACVGKKNDDTQLEIYKRCMEHIKQVLKNRDSIISEDKRKGYLYCGGDPYQ